MLNGRAVIQTGSATEIPFEGNEFDLVICIEVLEHIDDDTKAYEEIASLMPRRARNCRR